MDYTPLLEKVENCISKLENAIAELKGSSSTTFENVQKYYNEIESCKYISNDAFSWNEKIVNKCLLSMRECIENYIYNNGQMNCFASKLKYKMEFALIEAKAYAQKLKLIIKTNIDYAL